MSKRFELIELSRHIKLKGSINLTPSTSFLTRERGEKAYPLLKKQLANTPNGEALVLVFPPSQLIDASFADETIVRLGKDILNGEFADRAILFQGLNSNSIKNINAVISLREFKLPLLNVEPEGNWEVIGHLEDHLHQTLRLFEHYEHLTANELMSLRGLAINTASTRLKRLHNLHLLRREYEITEKGLQYIYYFWDWTDNQTHK